MSQSIPQPKMELENDAQAVPLSVTISQNGNKDQFSQDAAEKTPVDKELLPVQPGIGKVTLLYGIQDRPPFNIAFISALQQMFTNMNGTLVLSFLVHKYICGGDDNVLLSQILASSILMCGLSTFTMSTFGVRLPIFQGSTIVYIPPLLAIMSADRWKCPTTLHEGNASQENSTDFFNDTFKNITSTEPQQVDGAEPWRERLLVISGAIMIANFIQVILAISGVISAVIRYVGPITLTAYLCTLTAAMAGFCVDTCKANWGIALLTMALIMIFNIVLEKVRVPIPVYNAKKGCTTSPQPIFKFFAQLFAVIVAWTLCGILTATGVFTDDPQDIGYKARTDAKGDVMSLVPIIYIPYPFQYGMPIANAGAVGAMLAAIFASILDSCGDYLAYAKIIGCPPPPDHAINRGLAMEGIATIISGSMGTGHGTSSFISAVGVILMTGVASRFVMQLVGAILIGLAVLGKVGAALCMIPEPIIGGLTTISVSAVFGVAMTNLEHVDMHSSRNQVILGSSVLLGLAVPIYIKQTPDAINTGSSSLDEMLTVLLSTAMLLAGILAFIMDNILPGSREMRGLAAQDKEFAECKDENEDSGLQADNPYKVYDLPFQHILNKYSLFSKIPICPQYKGFRLPSVFKRKSKKREV